MNGGLDMAIHAALGGRTIWVSEYEPPTPRNPKPSQGAARILAHRYPGTPNLGDISAIDWATVPPVRVLGGGFPCTDVSAAGIRAGLVDGTRSGLWARFADAIQHLRPDLVVIENVRGLLSAKASRGDAEDPELDPLIAQLLEDGNAETDTDPAGGDLGSEDEDLGNDDDPGPVLLRALGAVLGDLAGLGYDAVWCGLRAADVDAPHGRFRIFILAWPAEDADGATGGQWWESAPGEAPPGWARAHPGGRGGAPAADADSNAIREQPEPVAGRCGAPVAGLVGAGTASHTNGEGSQVRICFASDDGAKRTTTLGSDRDRAPSDADGLGLVRQQPGMGAREDAEGCSQGSSHAPANPDSGGQRPDEPELRAGQPHVAWGDYAPAIARWESTLGRVAPAPTELSPRGSQRLSPVFVEWLMGLPAGWVTDVPGLSRNDQLKALGNGVVPQQGAAAIRYLLQFVPAYIWEAIAA